MKVDFFYDVVSPFSYYALEVLQRYEKPWNLEINYIPFFLGAIMNVTGNQPPATLPVRGRYLVHDTHRCARYFGIPLKLPENFPVLSLHAIRVLNVIKQDHPKDIAAISKAIYQAFFNEDGSKDISKKEVLVAILEESKLFSKDEIKRIMEKSVSEEVKNNLKKLTEEAAERGVYGSPTMFFHKDGEELMFFGSDRFHVIANELGLKFEGPFPGKAKL